MNFYKVPTDLVSIESLRQLRGTEGSYLNPILDENDLWIISIEEWNSPEFQYLKTEYPDLSVGFELIDTLPKSYPELDGIGETI